MYVRYIEVMRSGVAVLIIMMAAESGLGRPADPPIEQLMQAATRNARSMMEAMPQFTCDEKMTFGTNVVESEFRIIRQQTPLGHSFLESRRVRTMNGDNVLGGNQQRVNGVVISTVGALLVPPIYEFRLVGQDVVNGNPASVVEYRTKADQKPEILRENGKVWLAVDSQQPLRIERHSYPSESPAGFESIEYERLVVEGQTYWMPLRTKSSSEGNVSSPGDFVRDFEAQYSNCTKSMVPVPDEIIKARPAVSGK